MPLHIFYCLYISHVRNYISNYMETLHTIDTMSREELFCSLSRKYDPSSPHSLSSGEIDCSFGIVQAPRAHSEMRCAELRTRASLFQKHRGGRIFRACPSCWLASRSRFSHSLRIATRARKLSTMSSCSLRRLFAMDWSTSNGSSRDFVSATTSFKMR